MRRAPPASNHVSAAVEQRQQHEQKAIQRNFSVTVCLNNVTGTSIMDVLTPCHVYRLSMLRIAATASDNTSGQSTTLNGEGLGGSICARSLVPFASWRRQQQAMTQAVRKTSPKPVPKLGGGGAPAINFGNRCASLCLAARHPPSVRLAATPGC